MKKIQHLLLIVLLSIGFSVNTFAQNNPKFEINKVLPSISIHENKLAEVQTLTDLDKRYPSSWVKEYISVEISISQNGTTKKAMGKNNALSQEQKELLQLADLGSEIAVTVLYIPENSLKNNDAHLYDFKVTVTPEKNAEFAEGAPQLIQYLQKSGIDKIDSGSFQGYDLTAIKFTITDQGQITDVQVALPSKDKNIDELLVSAILKMPTWKPAEFSNGKKIKQDFVLTVGNMDNCMVNLLNIRPME